MFRCYGESVCVPHKPHHSVVHSNVVCAVGFNAATQVVDSSKGNNDLLESTNVPFVAYPVQDTLVRCWTLVRCALKNRTSRKQDCVVCSRWDVGGGGGGLSMEIPPLIPMLRSVRRAGKTSRPRMVVRMREHEFRNKGKKVESFNCLSHDRKSSAHALGDFRKRVCTHTCCSNLFAWESSKVCQAITSR